MPYVTIENPDSQLAQLVKQATHGEEVIIVHDHKPVAKLVSLPEASENPQPKRPGFGSGKYALIYMADDFDAPLEDFKDYM